jgi:hypothetical protein
MILFSFSSVPSILKKNNSFSQLNTSQVTTTPDVTLSFLITPTGVVGACKKSIIYETRFRSSKFKKYFKRGWPAEYGLGGQTIQEGQFSQEGHQAVQGEGVGIPSWLIILTVVVVAFLDFKFFGGTLTYLLLSIISRGGGSAGGGGASRGW